MWWSSRPTNASEASSARVRSVDATWTSGLMPSWPVVPKPWRCAGSSGSVTSSWRPAAALASVWARGRLRRLPDGLALGVPTRLGPLARSGIVSPLGTARAALDLVARPARRGAGRSPDRPVAEITRRRLGREVTARLVDPLIGGIHAGDTTRMSAAAVFPALLEAASAGGSLMRALRSSPSSSPPAVGGPVTGVDGEPPVFYAVRGGLSRLVERLAEALGARGVDVRVGAPVGHLELRRHDGGVDRGRTRGALGPAHPPGHRGCRRRGRRHPGGEGGGASRAGVPPRCRHVGGVRLRRRHPGHLAAPGARRRESSRGHRLPRAGRYGLPRHGVHVAHLEVARAPSPRRRLAAGLDGPLR